MLLGALVLIGAPSLAAAQALSKCTLGQAVTDQEGKNGVIVSAASNLCQVKYPDGQVYGWIYWNLRPAAASAQPGSPADDAKLPAAGPAPATVVPLPTILKPAPSTRTPVSHTLVYRVDKHGQIKLTAMVNEVPVRFIVDTGANVVALTLEDARAVGFDPDALIFNVPTRTANGVALSARVMLREIRIEQLSINNIPASVVTNLSAGSVLGMSFLTRVRFEMREGALTISW
ncbi:MAG: TIGR02281 family clan AA aspartic protease [Alphaproteobacteria bacterium]|nr:TIGR02281 family clan AA aspartic protease [Alphaproteobacteria bacterium]